MGMPAAKKRRVDLDDSFDDDSILLKDTSPNDSFDEDPIEPGPSLVAEKILQSQALRRNPSVEQTQLFQTSNEPGPAAKSVSMETMNRISQDISAFRCPDFQRPKSPPHSTLSTGTQSTTSTILTGGQKESGVVVMMKKRNENLTRQLEDARREKVTKEMVHLQEKRDLESGFKNQLKNLQTQKDQLQRELLSMSFRHDNLNVTLVAHDANTTIGANKSFIPTKPVERKPGVNPSNRLAWMNKPGSGANNAFKHPASHNADDTYVHFTTQMMESSTFMPTIFPSESREEVKRIMVNAQCQTVEQTQQKILKASKREEIIEGLLLAAVKMKKEDFNAARFEELCRDSGNKPLCRQKTSDKLDQTS